MDVRLEDVQINIAQEARRFMKQECPAEYVRRMYEDERGFTKEVWGKLVELGWTAMRIPEQYEGMGMGQIELSMVLEEMGRAAFPGPYFSTVVLAAEALMEAGTDAQKKRYLPAIVRGEILGTLALVEPDAGADPSYIQMPARAEGKGFVLSGTKLGVPDAHVANFVVCAARTLPGKDPSHGITLFLVDTSAKGVSVTLEPTMDGSRKLSTLRFDEVKIGPEAILGPVHNGWLHLQRVLQRASVGLCAECVGGAQRLVEITPEYAKTRVQFDQPIGSFQAIKHRCAQMYAELESARSILYWAAWSQDHGDAKEAALAASAAKVYCSQAFLNAAKSSIQIHGAAGFVWESECHFFLKRAKANEVSFGDPVYHREKLAQLLT